MLSSFRLSQGSNMQKLICLAFLIAAVSSTPALAKRPRSVDEALKKEYPDAKTEIVNTRTINGVKLFDVKITSRSEEHTSELQSQSNLVCRLLLEKKKK